MWEAQRGKCPYCFANILRPDHGSREHVWPLAILPKEERDPFAYQVILTCRPCNFNKGGRPPTGCELIALDWVSARYREMEIVAGLPVELSPKQLKELARRWAEFDELWVPGRPLPPGFIPPSKRRET